MSDRYLDVRPPAKFTDDELADAAWSAVFASLLHSGQCYGLIEGPQVDIERADAFLDECRRRGVRIPTADEVIASLPPIEAPTPRTDR